MKELKVTFYFHLILDDCELDYISKEIVLPTKTIPSVGNIILFNTVLFEFDPKESDIKLKEQYDQFIEKYFTVSSVKYFTAGVNSVSIYCTANFKN